MASTQPYDLQAIQDNSNILVNNDADTPATSDDEWSVRTGIANMAIVKWESQETLWDELWQTYTHAATLSAATRTYTLSLTDRRFWGGYVRLVVNGTTEYVKVIKPHQYTSYGGEARVIYFTGNNRDGWTMVLGWTPATTDSAIGATIQFDYYRYATKLSATTDKSEISEPGFIVYDMAATKSLLESKRNQYSVFDAEATRIMDVMRTMNDLDADGSGGITEDYDAVLNGAIIGD